MKPPLLISDSGPIISLALLDQLELLTRLFDDVRIPSAVWEELTEIRFSHDFSKIAAFFQSRVIKIERENYDRLYEHAAAALSNALCSFKLNLSKNQYIK